MNWLSWKLHYPRCELIYLLGGIPREHINTLHYRNVQAVVDDMLEKSNRLRER